MPGKLVSDTSFILDNFVPHTHFIFMLRFDNTFVSRLPADPLSGSRRRQVHGALFSRIEPTPVRAPRLIAHSREVAAMLDLAEAYVASPEFAPAFGANALLPGMQPYAAHHPG